MFKGILERGVLYHSYINDVESRILLSFKNIMENVLLWCENEQGKYCVLLYYV